MEDYPYPIVVEGDWKPEHMTNVKNKLQIYFQTRDDVLSKTEHMISIDNHTIKLNVSKPADVAEQPASGAQKTEKASGYQELDQSVSPAPAGSDAEVRNPQELYSGSCAVLLENVPHEVTKDVLALLVETVCSASENDFSMEIIRESKAAVLIFNKPSAVGKFLEESRTHRKFQQFGLNARVLERSACVRVENLSAEANSKMFLELFFEKCGGPVEEIIMVPAEQAAIITFKKEEDKEKVLKTEHNVCSVPVKIYPYYKSLNTALYGGNRPTWKLPEAIAVRVHPVIREFLLKKELPSISHKMGSQFCQINMDSPEVLLSPDPALLKQKGLTRRQIDDWRKNASDTFKNIISNFAEFALPVPNSLWTKVESDIKRVVKDQFLIHMDPSKEVLTLAGVAHDIIVFKPNLEKILEQASTKMERKRNNVTEDVEMTPTMFSLLQQDGLKNAACPQLHFHYNKNLQKLHLSGLQTEILIFKNWILEKKLSIKQKSLKTDHPLLEFLRTVDCDEMSRHLFMSHGISAVYTVENGDVILSASTEHALVEAEMRMKTALIFTSFIAEDVSVLRMSQWHDLCKQLRYLYNTSKNKTVYIIFSPQRDKVTVSGFREPVNEVSQNLRDFIKKCSRIEDAVRLKSHAVAEFIKVRKSHDWQRFMKPDEVKVNFDLKRPCVKLSGERRFVQTALTFFKKMADALHTDTLIIKKAGAKKYFQECKYMLSVLQGEVGFVAVLQEDHMLEEEADDHNNSRFEDSAELVCEVQMPAGVTVTVRKADICKFRVDAVVNAANEDLQHSGGVALALLQAAGPNLQQCCDMYVRLNGPLRCGEAIITNAGRLPCKFVVHAVGPRYNGSDTPAVVHHLRSAVRESLKQASAKGCSSIAIPVISSGIFGCPLKLCTETIAMEVHEYLKDQKHRGELTEIHLVDNNVSTVKAMAQAVRKEFAAFSPKMSFPHHNEPRGYGDYRGRGRGRGYHRHRNQEFGDLGYGPKGRGNRDFKEQAQWREETSDFSGSRSDRFNDLSVLETKATQGPLKIILSKGNIQDTRADVIVNTISEDMDLSKGAISRSLLHTAGHQLQAEVRAAAPAHRLSYGEMVVTDGYNLKCMKVFHVVCPFWEGGRTSEDQTLIRIVRECLKRAETLQMTSLSFPAIGTGILGFPKDLVARIMMREFQEFSPRTLREVSVIVHPSDGESLDCFTRISRQEIQSPVTRGTHVTRQHLMPKTQPSGKSAQTPGLLGKVSSPSAGMFSMQVGPVSLEVSSGDITKENTDAIVNSSNHTFTLKSGVSKAILDAAGLQVEQECLQIANAPNFQQTVIVTSSGQLSCKNIIHIVGRNSPDEIKEIVLSVLRLCQTNQMSSVAFPALGTGQGGAKAADVADAMVDAVVDFVKNIKPGKVKLVKFLIFQTTMLADFQQSMLRRSGEKAEEDRSFFNEFKDGTKESSRNEAFVMVAEEFEPAVFQLCAETPQDLKKARDMINSFIMKDYLNIPIRDPAIGHFTRGDAEMLSNMQRELCVSIKLQRTDQAAVIILEGLSKDVHSAESQIRDMIRKVERDEKRRQQALILSRVVEWQYQDSGQNYKCFDTLINYDLEQAFQNKNPSVKIKINDEEYAVSVSRLEATRDGKQVQLKRVEVSAAQSSLPSHWEDMKGQSVVLVPLSAGSNEYTDVEKEFQKTGLTCQIIQIERMQNSTLWRNYMIKKEELEAKNNHKNNEKCLFHGTGPDKTDQINHHGFNRSYAGTNGAMYGNGSYFAVDPQYSAQGYSKPDAKGHKRMYLARVLVGDFTQGQNGLLAPPAKSSSGVDLYNSVTDNAQSPSMFVIFNDVQAYPEYLITFQ